MKKVLIIAYYFPPLGGGGVQRPLQWARYLPENGWLPTVLTVEEGYWSSRDEEGLRRIPPEVRVVRTPYLSAVSLRNRLLKKASVPAARPAEESPGAPPRSGLRRWLVNRARFLWQTPDEFLGWYPYAVRAGRRLLSEEKFDAVLTTAPPFTAHWIGRALRKGGGPPWIADFRDAWTKMPGYDHNALQLAIERPMEKSVLRWADAVFATTETTAEDFRALASIPGGRLHTLPNGYDPELYGKDVSNSPDKILRFVFTGTQILGQDAVRFLKTLHQWTAQNSGRRKFIRFQYAGPEGASLKAAAERMGAADLFEDLGYLPNTQIARIQQQAGVLVLLLYRNDVARSVIPGKAFEYLAAKRPVLAVAGPGEVQKLIERARAGWVLPPGDETVLRGRLEKIWSDWEASQLAIASDAAWIEGNFSRPRQTARLAQILSAVSGAS